MRDCAFQYATSDGHVFEDTELISRADAEELWQKYIDQFKEDLEAGRCPEMAIWIDMKDECNYHTTAAHWHGEDFIIQNGKMYSLVCV